MIQIYRIVEGVPIVNEGIDIRKVVKCLSINRSSISWYGFLKRFKRVEYSFDNVVVRMYNRRESTLCITILENGKRVFSLELFDLYELYGFQVEYWYRYGIEFMKQLYALGYMSEADMQKYAAAIYFAPVGERTDWDVIEVRPNYYMHKVDTAKWCLYRWVSGEDEESMDIYVIGEDIGVIKNKFREIVDKMDDHIDSMKVWSDVIYNEDGTFKLV